MIRWFRNWRARRKAEMCARIARLWAECEAELLAEIERSRADEWKRTKCDHVGKVGYFKGGAWVCQCEERR